MLHPLLLTLALGPLAHATPGEVTLSLAELKQLQARPAPPAAPPAALTLSRTLTGRIDDGLLSADLATDVISLAPLALPLLHGDATIARATLDSAPAPLQLAGDYQVELAAGRHRLQVDLLQGRTSERFERRVHLDLPDGGSTAFDLLLPEAPVDVTLAHGVLTSVTQQGSRTRVRGWLDARADLDLSWERRTTHTATDARTQTEAFALLDLGGDLVHGTATFTTQVLAGELDRLALSLPAGVEIVEVAGPQVLQWHTAEGRLHVLLRSVVDESVGLTVAYQYPARLDAPTDLLMPHPDGEVRGALGIVAPVATQVALSTVDGGTELAPRDVPQGLVELSADPLRAALSFDEPPTATATTHRTGEVLTSASRIDDLQGISLLMEDGTEVGKLRLAVRNADRQVLTVALPEGARLTHCFRDGAALRPAADPAHPGHVIVPLSRSAKAASRSYTVQPGDTLSGIASDNYGDANRWQEVQLANPNVASHNLQVGQVIDLPVLADAETESFVLELGWERSTRPLSAFGQRTIGLPELDLDVMAATWHLYLPEHLEPLTIDANLVQLSGRRTDPLTRAVDFLVHSGTFGGAAYAGDMYKNALMNRRSSYFATVQEQVAEPLSSWPLVGQRIRFRGQLLGTEAPRATVRYVGERAATATRTVGWALALCLAAAWARRPRSPLTLGAAGVGAMGSLVLGHYLLGTYGLILQGAFVGLILGLLPWLWSQRRRPKPYEVVIALSALPMLGVMSLLLSAYLTLFGVVALTLLAWRTR